MRKGQTRMQYLAEQKQKAQARQDRLKLQIEREQLQQQIYLRQVAELNRKARTRRLIQIGAIFASNYEIIEQYELDEIANFFTKLRNRGFAPEHKAALPNLDK